ncbi:D-alanine--D-alanine ligase [Amorphoplanes auranticolor]|uniref:D-alanine--D-alanine ligase n=1 Tax=Actinoplanes auranticolor TaxID=47988 RepID=A0A919S8U3_9ACTN|nr:D-alanine--D-alanine ligase [Actinoplanes auranticolor]
MTPIRVAVIGGGRNGEHDVSLGSAAAVANALDPGRYDVVRLTIERDGRWRKGTGPVVNLAAAVEVLAGCDVAVPMVHGPRGEDGSLAALLEFAGVPYAGSGVQAGALAMNKWATKVIAEAEGISTAPGVVLTAATAERYRLTGPVVVKPVAAGSSQGVTLVSEPAGLALAVRSALSFDDRILVEDMITGREIDVAVLGRADGTRVVSPALEIAVDGFFDYTAKYDGSARFLVPAPLTTDEQAALEDAALVMYDALGCGGVARIDFFLTAAGPVLNEVNTAPGFTEHSQVPRMFAAAGTAYPMLLDLLIGDALAGRS